MKRLTIKVRIESVKPYGSTEHEGEASFSLDYSVEISKEVQEKFIDIMPVLIATAGESHLEKINEQVRINKELKKDA